MKHTILKDKKILERDYNQWAHEDSLFWQQHLGITPEYTMIEVDCSDYPTYIDSDGDIRPTDQYLQNLNDLATKKDGHFGVDFVMVMIHEDNWKSDNDQIKGIWGTNYSYIFGKQCLEYCRWDKDNDANTFGTAYHERHHSFDAMIKIETGVDVRPLLDVQKYDHEITHGNKNPPWKYIRHKQNTESLKIMKPHLLASFEARRKKHDEVVEGLMGTIINLATQVVYLLKIKQNSKNGVPRTTL